MDEFFKRRIKIVEGSMDQPNIGIEPELLQEIIDSVQVVIHAASEARFDKPLLEMIEVNMKGTLALLNISKKMKKLNNFIYISTAFSHCPRSTIDEEFYQPPIDPDVMLKLLNHLDTRNIDILTPRLIAPWPNSYVYTKALTEELVRRCGSDIPVIVVRPSASNKIEWIFFFVIC